MGKRLLVSVIIPTYNRADFLYESLNSVIKNLVEKDMEVIIVDDGSSDNTYQVVSSFSDKRIKYIYQVNKGVSAARNKGIIESRGTWICFLDSDDLWLENKIEKQIITLEKTKTLWCYTDEIWIRDGVRINQHKKHQKKEGRIYIDSLPLCIVSPSSVIIHKDVFNKVGLFDESLLAAEDYDMWLRISSRYDISLTREKLVVKRGGHKDQLSKILGIDMYRVRALRKSLFSRYISLYEKDLTLFYLLKKAEILKKGFYKHGKYHVAEYYNKLIEEYKSCYLKINFL